MPWFWAPLDGFSYEEFCNIDPRYAKCVAMHLAESVVLCVGKRLSDKLLRFWDTRNFSAAHPWQHSMCAWLLGRSSSSSYRLRQVSSISGFDRYKRRLRMGLIMIQSWSQCLQHFWGEYSFRQQQNLKLRKVDWKYFHKEGVS